MVHNREGFTLIEILVVLGILGLLMAVLIPGTMYYIAQAKYTAANSKMQRIQAGIQMYNLATGKYPKSLTDLVRKPADQKVAAKWRGPYGVKDIDDLEDPWENPFQYKLTPGGTHPYELYSIGEKGEDRLSVWEI